MSRFEKDFVILGLIVIIVMAILNPKAGNGSTVSIYPLPVGFFFGLAGLSFFLRYCAGIKNARRAWHSLWS